MRALKMLDQDPSLAGFGYSNFDTNVFRFCLSGRPTQVDVLSRAAQDVFADFVVAGPAKSELENIKETMTHEFERQRVRADELLVDLAELAWNDLPLDWLATREARVKAVTAKQVQEAFARCYLAKLMLTAIVGRVAKKEVPAEKHCLEKCGAGHR